MVDVVCLKFYYLGSHLPKCHTLLYSFFVFFCCLWTIWAFYYYILCLLLVCELWYFVILECIVKLFIVYNFLQVVFFITSYMVEEFHRDWGDSPARKVLARQAWVLKTGPQYKHKRHSTVVCACNPNIVEMKMCVFLELPGQKL